MMKLISEDQLLDIEFRKEVIKEIKEVEDVRRKAEHLKRYEIYRDKTRAWIEVGLNQEGFKDNTLKQMLNRVTNISICRKMVNKLARTYRGGVERKAFSSEDQPNEQDQKSVDDLSRLLKINRQMKKGDRFRELSRQALAQIVPERNTFESNKANRDLFDLKIKIHPPHLYDVIEDAVDNEKMRVVILSEFVEQRNFKEPATFNVDTRVENQATLSRREGDGREQIIADSRVDRGQEHRHFIWWSDSLHFTTNDSGDIIEKVSPPDNENPIKILPFVNLVQDQDGHFWAEGGDDMIDGSILINKILTDMNGIAFVQGWGQLIITGKRIPKTLEGGPHNALIFEQEDGDTVSPKAEYISANPDLIAWMRMAEMYIALVLSTNNLSPGSVSGKLDPSNVASGISKMLDLAEATDSLEERQADFKDFERELWDIVRLWHGLFHDGKFLTPKFQDVAPINIKTQIVIKFLEQKPIISEEQKLQVIKLRKELGIDTMVGLLKIDNPDLTDDEAEQLLAKILKEKLDNVSATMRVAIKEGDEDGVIPGQEKKEEKEEK